MLALSVVHIDVLIFVHAVHSIPSGIRSWRLGLLHRQINRRLLHRHIAETLGADQGPFPRWHRQRKPQDPGGVVGIEHLGQAAEVLSEEAAVGGMEEELAWVQRGHWGQRKMVVVVMVEGHILFPLVSRAATRFVPRVPVGVAVGGTFRREVVVADRAGGSFHGSRVGGRGPSVGVSVGWEGALVEVGAEVMDHVFCVVVTIGQHALVGQPAGHLCLILDEAVDFEPVGTAAVART